MKEAEKLGHTFVFLSVKEAQGRHSMPATMLRTASFVIGKNGKIAYAYAGEDYKVRAVLKLAPDNYVIRKQIWTVEHPEKFYPVID